MNHDQGQSRPCDACQQLIKFVVMEKSGKPMPVDAKMEVAQEDMEKGSFVLPNGTMKRSVKRGECYYVPHWSTCNDPGRFRGR